jgi:hypothetical protein
MERLVELRSGNVVVAGRRVVLRRDEPVSVGVHLQRADDEIGPAGQRVAVSPQRDDRALGREGVEVPPERDPLLPRDVQALLQLASGRRPHQRGAQRLQHIVARHGLFGSMRMASAIRVFAD